MQIIAKDVSKSYDSFSVLKDVSFSVNKGEILGVIGPNGAGKTTLLKLLSGISDADSGTIRINRKPMNSGSAHLKRLIGYLPEESPVYDNMTVMEYLLFFAALYSVPSGIAAKRAMTLLKQMRLPNESAFLGSLSKGTVRKVLIARSLINSPDVLLYDELASGLDPLTADFLLSFLRKLKKSGKTIVFSAHDLFRVERVCDRILFMDKGRILFSGSVEKLKGASFRYKIIYGEGNKAFFHNKKEFLRFLNTKKAKLVDVSMIEPSLEEVFVSRFR